MLVDEEPDGLGPLQVEREENSQRDGDEGASCSEERIVEDTNMAPCLGVRRREPVQHNGLKRHGSFKYSACPYPFQNFLVSLPCTIKLSFGDC